MKSFLYFITCMGVTLIFSMHTQAQFSHRYKLPAYRTSQERTLMMQQKPEPDEVVFGKAGQMPANVRYPGEFEESQAVIISWSPEWDVDGNVIGVDVSTEYALMSAQCAKYMSDELAVWIRIPFGKDSNSIKNMMIDLGWPLTKNYRFLIMPGDDWWVRDFGPNGIYYGSKDSVGYVDLKYYAGRNKDNVFPANLSLVTGHKNFITKMNGEGGNLMSDGFGKVFFSDVFTRDNGMSVNHFPLWSTQQTLDTVKNVFNATELHNLKGLQCDGGTGHIDLYVKLMDEQTLFVSKYPDTVSAQDKQIIEDNYQYFTTLKTTYNRPFRIYRIPMPTGDDGTYNLRTCTQIDGDARTFVNGITINKTFIYPSYSDNSTGNQAQTAEMTKAFKKLLPGYKIVPIDSRPATLGGGAIHCIAMQVPAENPVLFWHPSVDGKQPIQSSYHIVAKITNISGIKKAECHWRKKNDGVGYRVVTLTDSSGYFIGDIPSGTLTTSDWIVYYLRAETNNGRSAVKPVTAPEGYYEVYFTDNKDSLTLGESRIDRITEKNYLFAAYPVPATHTVTVPFYLLEKTFVEIVITDMLGRNVKSVVKNNLPAGMHREVIDAVDLGSGIYLYSLYLDGLKLNTRKLVIER